MKQRQICIPKKYRDFLGFLGFLVVVWIFGIIWAIGPGIINNLVLDRIEKRVVQLRELDSSKEIRRIVISSYQWRTIQTQSLAAIDSDTEVEIRNNVLTLKAFGMLERDVSNRQILSRFYTNLLGFFDRESDAIYIISDNTWLKLVDKLVFAHEFTHALQNQNLEMPSSLRFSLDDTLLAARALTEGDAKLLEQMYKEAYLSDADITSLEEQVAETSTLGTQELEVVDGIFAFPYWYGPGFVESLHEQGGWATVNAAYSNPPQTSEQILHPDRYLAGEQSQVVDLPALDDVLGDDWRQVGNGILGEYVTFYYLYQHVPTESARIAADGWGGDRYIAYSNSSGTAFALVLRTAWDTTSDRDEFVGIYNAYANAWSGGRLGNSKDAVTCWSDEKDYLCITWNANSTTVVLGPDESTTDLILQMLDVGNVPVGGD